MALTDFLTQIADSIRSKDGTTDLIVATDFPQRILDIPSGGGSGLPDSVKTGTFTVAEDTVETITIPHGLGATPTMFFIFPDNPEYIIGNIGYTFMGTAKDIGITFATKHNKMMALVYNIYTVTCDDTNIILTNTNESYLLRAGVTYRWFAWRV